MRSLGTVVVPRCPAAIGNQQVSRGITEMFPGARRGGGRLVVSAAAGRTDALGARDPGRPAPPAPSFDVERRGRVLPGALGPAAHLAVVLLGASSRDAHSRGAAHDGSQWSVPAVTDSGQAAGSAISVSDRYPNSYSEGVK